MKRRTAGVVSASPRSSASAPERTAPRPKKNMLMHVGGDYHGVLGDTLTSRENLEYNLRCGVRHLLAQDTFLTQSTPEGAWDLDELKQMRDNCDQYGVFLEGIRMDSNYILLGKGPERDRKLEVIRGNVRKAAAIGMKVITFHWAVIPVRRNETVPGRGGASYKAFTLEPNWKELPVGEAGRVSSDDYWERLAYFLEKVIPVAAECDVRMACHPYDPPGLPLGYMGADNWDHPSLFEALKRYAATVDSPYNGFQLCVATCFEESCLRGTSQEQVYKILQYFGQRQKLFSIHLRNVKGRPHHFEMVYADEGDVDFYRVIKILRDTQYPYSILPDGQPTHPDDPGCVQASAFGFGYIQGLIQAANAEAA